MYKLEDITQAEMYAGAYFLAISAHRSQVDKSGRPYIEHAIRVADNFDDYTVKTIAILHDVLEDTWVTEDMLRRMFPELVVDALVFLTRKHDESYGEYIKRMCVIGEAAYFARKVKIVDLTDNMDLGRLDIVDDTDLDRVKKYNKWRDHLKKCIEFGTY